MANELTKIPKFRRCVLQNFPFIEQDFDALTDYQLLCKVVEYLNKVITSQNEVTDITESLAIAFNDLHSFVDNYFDNLDVQEEINNKLDQMAEDGTLAPLLESAWVSYTSSDKTHIDLTTKANLLPTVWTIGANWAESGTGFVHVSGDNAVLSNTVTGLTIGDPYVLKFTCTNQYANNANPALTAEFGDSGTWEQYSGDGTVTKIFTFYPTATSAELKFTPSSSWNGSVYDIALYHFDSEDVLPQSLQMHDENNDVTLSTILTDKAMSNISISDDGLKMSTLGATNNVVIGNNSLAKTANSYFNTAIGNSVLTNSINGSRNVGIGYASMYNMKNGDRNIGIGTFSLNGVTNGRDNIGIGADAGWKTTTGSYNTAIGGSALDANTTGNYNTAIGYLASASNVTGIDNLAIGYFSHYKGTADNHNIALGWQSMMSDSSRLTATNYNVAIGYEAYWKPNGDYNVAIGWDALKAPTSTTTKNVAIGYDTMSRSVTGSTSNIAIGNTVGRNIAGDYNIVLGASALNGACGDDNVAIGTATLASTTGAGNVAVGRTAGNGVTSGNNNVFLGYHAGTSVTTASNCIMIGNVAGHNVDGEIQIGNAINYQNGCLALCGQYGTTLASVYLPAGSTSKAPLRLEMGTLMTTPARGCIEYDGNHLYFTNNAGTRKQLAEA